MSEEAMARESITKHERDGMRTLIRSMTIKEIQDQKIDDKKLIQSKNPLAVARQHAVLDLLSEELEASLNHVRKLRGV